MNDRIKELKNETDRIESVLTQNPSDEELDILLAILDEIQIETLRLMQEMDRIESESWYRSTETQTLPSGLISRYSES